MDALIDDDLDNNNNVIPILNNNNNNQNQVNLNNPPIIQALNALHEDQIDERNLNIIINNNMDNDIHTNRVNAAEIDPAAPPPSSASAAAAAAHDAANHSDDIDNMDGTENGITNHNHRLIQENMQNIRPQLNHNAANAVVTNVRKSKKRKRHYNLNKNKKWNKPYKRQKSANAIKPDTENATQNNRNKHSYTKIPKIIFNNKQALHRGSGLSKFFLPDKRPRKDIIVPPTKFLLGGNISDPLNLNSLQDEALVSMSAVTPKSSPITTPPKVEVIIPPNIYDPLHLLDPVDSIEYEKRLVSPVKNRRLNKQRSRKKKIRKHSSGELLAGTSIENADLNEIVATAMTTAAASSATTTTTSITTSANADSTINSFRSMASPKTADISLEFESIEQQLDDGDVDQPSSTDGEKLTKRDLHLDLSAGNLSSRKRKNSESGVCSNAGGSAMVGSKNKLRRFDSKDKIVSPVIPQPGAWKRPPKVLPMGAPRNRNRTTSTSDNDNNDEPNNKRTDSATTAATVSEDLKIGSINVPVVSSTGDSSPERTITATITTTTPHKNYECDQLQLPSTSIIENPTFNPQTKLNADGICFKKESIKYQFGNYAGQYCGLQNLNNFSDVRLTVFLRHAYLFKDKDILDIGCNVGHMTIAVASRLHPKSIVGIDIDKNLIARARRNLSFFQRINHVDKSNINKINNKNGENVTQSSDNDIRLNNEKEKCTTATANTTTSAAPTRKSKFHRTRDRDKCSYNNDNNQIDFFPVSFPICFGGLPNIKQKIETTTSTVTVTSVSTSSPNNGSQISKTIEQTQTEAVAATATTTDTKSDSTAVPSTSKEINSPKQITTTTAITTTPATTATAQIESDENSIDSFDTFPDNVFFRTLNYAVTDESQMVADKQQYDLILCLSLTKWIHLNFGDAGLKMTFRRMFNQLRPGGKLILEAQNWASYRKRKKLTPTIFNNYKNIEFFPNNFHEYLLSPEVGFSHSYTLGVPRHASKGFYRPIQLYIKGDFTPSQVRWSDTYHPQTPYEPRIRYAHYVDPMRRAYGSFRKYHNMSHLYNNRDTPFSIAANRYNTPSHGISASTSRYYNPMETDSYLPSYDNVVPTRHYCFASPLYSTVWSPPASGRKSASQTPLFGSIRRVDADEQDIGTKHVYLTPRAFDGGGSSRSIDESNSVSPQTHVYAVGSSRSVRDSDLDANTNSPKEHVYAFQ